MVTGFWEIESGRHEPECWSFISESAFWIRHPHGGSHPIHKHFLSSFMLDVQGNRFNSCPFPVMVTELGILQTIWIG